MVGVPLNKPIRASIRRLTASGISKFWEARDDRGGGIGLGPGRRGRVVPACDCDDDGVRPDVGLDGVLREFSFNFVGFCDDCSTEVVTDFG